MSSDEQPESSVAATLSTPTESPLEEELVDLSDEEVPPFDDEPSLEVAPYDPAEDREKVRGRIAQTLVWLLVGIVIVSLAVGAWLAIKTESGVEALKVVLELILTPIVGLVGAVTGFYFGEKSGRKSG